MGKLGRIVGDCHADAESLDECGTAGAFTAHQENGCMRRGRGEENAARQAEGSHASVFLVPVKRAARHDDKWVPSQLRRKTVLGHDPE